MFCVCSIKPRPFSYVQVFNIHMDMRYYYMVTEKNIKVQYCITKERICTTCISCEKDVNDASDVNVVSQLSSLEHQSRARL